MVEITIGREEKIMNSTIVTKEAPAAIGPYSQGIIAGDLVFVSGQIPVNPETGNVEANTIKEQARQSLENVSAVLKEAGLTLKDVVKTTCFISSMEDFAEFNEVYSEYFTDVTPARSCIAAKELPKKVLCEVEVIARK